MKIQTSKPTLLQFGVLLVTGFLAIGASAQPEPHTKNSSPFTAGLEIGTTGIGPVVSYTPSPKLNFSLSYGRLYGDDNTLSGTGTDYAASLNFTNLAAIADWHPTEGRFHISAGAVFFDYKIRATGKAKNGTSYDIGGRTYSTPELTSLTGTSSKSSVAPYLGIGWTWQLGGSGFSLTTNLGLMYTGNYETKLTGTGPIVTDPTFITDLRREERDLAKDFKFFPVIKVGCNYRF